MIWIAGLIGYVTGAISIGIVWALCVRASRPTPEATNLLDINAVADRDTRAFSLRGVTTFVHPPDGYSE